VTVGDAVGDTVGDAVVVVVASVVTLWHTPHVTTQCSRRAF
jgi:hypothetical protein